MNKLVKNLGTILLGITLVSSCGKDYSNDANSKSQETDTVETYSEKVATEDAEAEQNHPAGNKKDWSKLDLSGVKSLSNDKLAEIIVSLISECDENQQFSNSPFFAQLVTNIVTDENHLLIIQKGGESKEVPSSGMKAHSLTVEGYPIPQSANNEKYEISFISYYGEEHEIEISIYEKDQVVKKYKWSK